MVRVELVANSAEDCQRAEAAGAQRIELVSSIELGGLTPTLVTVAMALDSCSLPLAVMVRPRAGGFHYSQTELLQMIREIEAIANLRHPNLLAIVTGALRADLSLDTGFLRRARAVAPHLEFVCNRCFDLTPDPYEAMESLIDCGFQRILTSGQRESAELGIPILRQLHLNADRRVEVLPAGGIRSTNARRIQEETGCQSLHLGPFKALRESSSREERGIDYGEHWILDSEAARATIEALQTPST